MVKMNQKCVYFSGLFFQFPWHLSGHSQLFNVESTSTSIFQRFFDAFWRPIKIVEISMSTKIFLTNFYAFEIARWDGMHVSPVGLKVIMYTQQKSFWTLIKVQFSQKCFILGNLKAYYIQQVNLLFILIPNLKGSVDK